MKKKISIIGKYKTGDKAADGQSIKTRIIDCELEKRVGSRFIQRIDTYGWKKHPCRVLFNSVKAVCNSENVIFLTDAGGIKIYPWLLLCVNFFVRTKIHYVVIGGWLVHFVKEHKLLAWFLKHLNNIFVETKVMKSGLESLGFNNVHLMPNFKDLILIKEDELATKLNEPFRFCIFSRIMKEKGIEYAVKAVHNINSYYGRDICTLDMYGEIDSNQVDWFEEIKASFSDAINYYGVIPFDESVQVLKDYSALLFPTQFYTEGIPGTIIDAYAAGVPVIASEWESVYDIIDPENTGMVFPFDTPESIEQCMINLIEEPEKFADMKRHCLKKAEQYLPDAVMDILMAKLS